MKNKILIVLLIIILLSLSVCIIGCNSTSGRNSNVYLSTYRHDGLFVLPIKVSMADTPPDSIRHFKSKMSLSEIYNSLCVIDGLRSEHCESFIIVKDLSDKNFGYCIIYPKQVGQFNYIVNNMACIFKSEKSDYLSLEILAPVHLIPALMEDNALIENKEYELKASKGDIISFYLEYEFEVEEFENRILVKDTIGRKIGDKVSFDETINVFEVLIYDTTIMFRQYRGV